MPETASKNIVELVENGVDLNVFGQTKDYSQTKEGAVTRLVYMGRLVDWKCVDVLLEVASLLRDQKIPFVLDILGNGKDEQVLRAQASQLKLDDCVIFHGFRPQKECADVLLKADCLVLPSVFECGGAVVLEAMALELPVVATNWGGPADYLDPSCGILVDVPDSREEFASNFSDAVKQIIDQPEQRRLMGQAGRKKILEKYEWQEKAKSMKAIYATLIGAQNGDASSTNNESLEYKQRIA